ncbi:MAG: hypothetical protein N4A68_01200 [Maledivibacter sp.]|nr:hypothetical protein [Maledivibacter sp.]
MRQVKIFSGRSLRFEDDINQWLKENINYNVVDIKMFRTEAFFYALVIYEVKN